MSYVSYRPEIDGLRTIAVVPVILFHLGFTWIGGGYFGVDVFFVISGFLITSIILHSIYSNNFSFKAFWIRRIKRIVPALLTMVAGSLVAAYLLAFRLNLPGYATDGLSAIFSYANFVMRAKGDYWGAKAESSPFLHCWSLSVEEQFYLFYPLFIFVLHKWKISISKALFSLMLISLIAFIAACIYYPRTAFYILPTRAWELAAGGLLGYFSVQHSQIVSKYFISRFLPPLGMLLVLISFLFPFNIQGVSAITLLPVAGTILIIGFTDKQQFTGKILAHPFLVALGKISYPMYLWHWPMIVIAKQLSSDGTLSVTTKIVIVLLTLLLAYLSNYFIEKPVRKTKNIFAFVIPMTIAAVIVCISFIIPWVKIYYESPFEERAFSATPYFINYNVPDSLVEQYATWGIVGGDTIKNKSTIIVVGDSHGAMWGKDIDDIARKIGHRVSFFTMKGGNPLESGYQPAIYDLVKSNSPCLVLICCRWNDRDFTTIKQLLQFGGDNHARFLVINQPPLLPAIYEDALTELPQYFTYKKYAPKPQQPQYLPASNVQEVKRKNAELLTLTKSFTGCAYLDVYRYFAKGDSVEAIFDNKALYWDDDHLSNQGSQLLKPVLQKAITENLQLLGH